MPTEEQLINAKPADRYGTNPVRWAHEFQRHSKNVGYEPMDHVWLTAWFGAAIEAGYAAAQRKDKGVEKAADATWNDALSQAVFSIHQLRR
jgi:hypothetical protein